MIESIWAGGQTGADRAGLDFAKSMGIPHGGWCPRGRRAEDGRIPPEYNLKETRESDYRERTRYNIEDTDGTIVFVDGPLDEESGSAYTLQTCQKCKRPHILVDLSRASIEDAAKFVRAFVRDNHIKILNVAGSRASVAPTIGQKVIEVLKKAFSEEAS